MQVEAQNIDQTIKKNSSGTFWKVTNILFIVLILYGLIHIIIVNKDKLSSYKDVLADMNYFYLAIAVGIRMLTAVFRSWRWYYLLVPIKQNLSKANILRININALAANHSMPGKLGVPVKAALLKKFEKIDVSRSLPSIFGEIFVEHSSEFVLAFFCVLIGGHLTKVIRVLGKLVQSQGFIVNFYFAGAVFVLIIVLYFLFRKKLKSMQFVTKISEAIASMKNRLDCLFYSYLITTINIVISYIGVWLVLAALGHPEVGLTFIIFAGSITNFVSLISPMPSGLGVREITFYGLYDLYFGLGGIAFLAILIIRFISYFGLFLLFLCEKLVSAYLKTNHIQQPE